MKIAIIGYSGAGKSDLAKKLGEKYQIPVLHLDLVNFTKNRNVRDSLDAKNLIKDFMENDSWVIDGNYSNLYQKERLEQADKIVFLDFSRKDCLKLAYRKNKESRKSQNNSTSKLDYPYLKWLLFEGRSKKYKVEFETICKTYSQKVIVCKNPNKVQEIIKSI